MASGDPNRLIVSPGNPRASQESEARIKAAMRGWQGWPMSLSPTNRGKLSPASRGRLTGANADNAAPPPVASPAGKFLVFAAVAALVLGSAQVSRAEPGIMRPSDAAGFWDTVFTPDLVRIARRDLGKTGPQLGLPSRLWCGDAVNRWRRKAGLTVVPSRRAIDQARYGRRISKPVVGALLISGRRGGSHVDVIAAVHGNGTVTTIGGNVGRMVSTRVRAARGIFIIPA